MTNGTVEDGWASPASRRARATGAQATGAQASRAQASRQAQQTPFGGLGRVIENPVSGERIVIQGPPPEGGSALAWELFLAPGGRVPNSHVHPLQEERFWVLAGQVRFRLGFRHLVAGPGDAVRVPRGRVHHFANAGPEEARVWVETEPALDIVAMFEAAAALAENQWAEGRATPRLVDLALFMRDFEAEVGAPYMPVVPVRLVVRMVAWLARTGGYDARYRRLRAMAQARNGPASPAGLRGAALPWCSPS